MLTCHTWNGFVQLFHPPFCTTRNSQIEKEERVGTQNLTAWPATGTGADIVSCTFVTATCGFVIQTWFLDYVLSIHIITYIFKLDSRNFLIGFIVTAHFVPWFDHSSAHSGHFASFLFAATAVFRSWWRPMKKTWKLAVCPATWRDGNVQQQGFCGCTARKLRYLKLICIVYYCFRFISKDGSQTCATTSRMTSWVPLSETWR